MQKQKSTRYQTSDYLDFDTATALVRKLYGEEEYTMSLLIGCVIPTYILFQLHFAHMPFNESYAVVPVLIKHGPVAT